MLRFSRTAVVALAVLCFLPSATPQKKRKDGLTEKHGKWLEEEVTYIITDDDRKASASSLSQISLSLWNEGQQDRAREVLQSAQTTFPADPLVTAVAKTVR